MSADAVLTKLTSHYQNVINRAYGLILADRKTQIKPIDIFYGLSMEKGSLAHELLDKAGIKPIKTNETNINRSRHQLNLENILRSSLSPAAKQAIIKSANLAKQHQHKYIGTEHLLAALIGLSDPLINQVLAKHNLRQQTLTETLDVILNNLSHFPQLAEKVESAQADAKIDSGRKKTKKTELVLDYFSTCLTDPQIQTNINPVIGREIEINRVIQILARKTKNNPILLGEPGVGKTAIIEGLAKKITECEVPDILLDKKIYALDMPMLVAGTTYRGDFETRLKLIVNETKKDPNIILFIDEIHNIIGAGSASGTMDAANILKPALARGDIRCIGATTFDDYKRSIEFDTALARRFQPIQVPENTPGQTVKIIQGIKTSFEKHHGVRVADEAIEAAVYLSHRYLTDKFLPDKAIDLIDEAAAAKKISLPADTNYKKMLLMEKELAALLRHKQQLVKEEKYEEAMAVKTKQLEIIKLIHELEQKTAIAPADQTASRAKNQITRADIIALVANSTKINIPDAAVPADNLTNLKTKLSQKIIGQSEVIDELVNTLKRSAIGLAGSGRPLGSFIFMGPSGVGKTHTARVLADHLFPGEHNLIRLDMSEFSESFNLSKLLGAPAGYVGYSEGGLLTEQVKRNPYSVVLLDEIEKAHPDIFNILLQILEDGRLTDAKGKTINFRNTIVVLTSNIGVKPAGAKTSMGFGDGPERETVANHFSDSLAEFLRPELINRVDRVLIFKSLDQTGLKQIIQLELENLNQTLASQNITLAWEQKLVNHLLGQYRHEHQGARAVRALIRDQIETPLADKILARKIKQRTINLKVKLKQITLE